MFFFAFLCSFSLISMSRISLHVFLIYASRLFNEKTLYMVPRQAVYLSHPCVQLHLRKFLLDVVQVDKKKSLSSL